MASYQTQITEAKAIVAMAFRNGPIEDVHGGKTCPTCSGNPEYSRITDPEMKVIMKKAVDRVYTMLRLKQDEPERFDDVVQSASVYTSDWDDPVFNPIDLLGKK